MCDRDHSMEDQERYEAGGLITRKRFGVMLAAGVAMLLPGVANAVCGHDGGQMAFWVGLMVRHLMPKVARNVPGILQDDGTAGEDHRRPGKIRSLFS